MLWHRRNGCYQPTEGAWQRLSYRPTVVLQGRRGRDRLIVVLWYHRRAYRPTVTLKGVVDAIVLQLCCKAVVAVIV